MPVLIIVSRMKGKRSLRTFWQLTETFHEQSIAKQDYSDQLLSRVCRCRPRNAAGRDWCMLRQRIRPPHPDLQHFQVYGLVAVRSRRSLEGEIEGIGRG